MLNDHRFADIHQKTYQQLKDFLNQKLCRQEALAIAAHLIDCEDCLQYLCQVLEAEKIFILAFNPLEISREYRACALEQPVL
jgi:hypothetical protein